MNEEVEKAITDLLKRMGYRNVRNNLGTIWYEDEGCTLSLTANICNNH